VFGATRLATHAEKAVLQVAAFQVTLEFALHIAWQFPALRRQVGGERRVVLRDDPIE
jgi:hypothetical protein